MARDTVAGPRRTVSVLATGLAAAAALAVFTMPAGTAVAVPAIAPPAVSAPTPPVAPAPPATTARAEAGDPAPFPAVVAGPASIGPGTVTETTGAGLCTAGFVFTAGERTFLGQAAHCGGTGDETETDGCTSDAVPLGTPVLVHGRDGTVTGTLAWSSWNTMQARGERDPDACAYNDLALVELPTGARPSVGSAVPFFGGPAGVRTVPLPAGTPVYGLTNPPGADGGRAVGVRSGAAAAEVGGGWGHAVFAVQDGVAGESGSPLLDAQGRAIGVLSSLTTTDDLPSVEYTDLGRALDYATRTDGPAGLALAGGPAFTAAPPGVDPRALATPAGPGLG
ncbi:serine protease [Pseudonocardia sp. ICBG1293]|uniref:serine protease n=1 Tax=Pseudonocardia sp. ICBG1293 TaxID=2844382 RepID=UPI001CCEB9A8|nr:serine protease [Pseudonocardia sp. ICBG1293]